MAQLVDMETNRRADACRNRREGTLARSKGRAIALLSMTLNNLRRDQSRFPVVPGEPITCVRETDRGGLANAPELHIW
jgi:hypothetical protein